MSLRTRLLLAFAAVVLIPLALLALGLRQEMTGRLADEYQRRVDAAVAVIREDLDRESVGIAARLASLERALVTDNRFRLAAVAGIASERDYLLDYAGTAMRLTGLSMLQIQDGEERVISSGHFRNEHGRVDAGLAAALAAAPGGVALVTVRGAEGDSLALARAEPFRIGNRPFTLIGGIAVDAAFLARLARGQETVVSLHHPRGQLSSGDRIPDTASGIVVGELQVPFITRATEGTIDVTPARVQVTQSLTPLRTLVRSVDAWFLLTALGAAFIAVALAAWVSSRISRPLVALAEKTAVLDLDRLDIEFDGGTDEVGRLSALLGDLAARLRASTARVRDAERRATVGDLARQINHDIRNGLIPLRNVMRHLAQVERDEPAALPAVFAERRQTVDSSIAYLETLATSYQRLSTLPERRACDVNTLVTDVVRAAQAHEHAAFDVQLAPDVPRILADPIALRRILENLVTNAADSLQSKPGRIAVSTALVQRNGEPPAIRLAVADTGRGMSREESARIFDHFYTTKEGGTGLGLSIVRRLVVDLHGRIAVESEPGRGTRMIVDIPVSSR